MKTPARVYTLLRSLLIGVALIGLVAGCNSAPQATPTPTKTPRINTETPVAQPTSQPATLAPTNTPRPTEAPSATPEPPTATPEPTPEPTAPPEPTAAPAPSPGGALGPAPTREAGVSIFTGLRPADPAVLERRPLAIKVDNIPEVIPQSGLDKADIVVESHKEGCFLRFTAIYQSQAAPKVGSIRSARLIDLELPAIFDAILVFSGAVGPVLEKLNQSDLGRQFLTSTGSGALFRDPNIAIPFNMFANTEAGWRVAEQQGWNQVPDPSLALAFSENPPNGGVTVQTVDIPAPNMRSSYLAQLRRQWTYDAKSGQWLRFQNGKPHVDAISGQQLTAANVVILGANHVKTLIPEQGTTLDQSECGNASIEIQLWGEGPLKVLRDGQVYEGRWVRAERHAPFRFLDAQGRDIPLKPGNSWWQVVPLEMRVTVTP